MKPTKFITCADCGETFETPDFSGDPLMRGFPDPELCDACFDARETRRIAGEERDRREKFARREWERVPMTYRETDPDHPDFPAAAHAAAEKWVKGASLSCEPRLPWLGIVGPSGRCKSRVAALCAKRLAWDGKALAWVNATQFQWCAQMQFDDRDGGKAREHLRRYRKTGALVFDDLGKQRWTDQVESQFYDLLEQRSSHGLALIWTSNTSLEALGKMLSRDRSEPIVGRLLNFSHILSL